LVGPHLLHGGSTIPPQTAKAFLDMGIKPQNIYGMTEIGSH
jgi:acyl-CoA synthetase